MRSRRLTGWLILLWAVRLVPAQSINGAGATFPYLIYAQWFDAYQRLHPGIEVNYDRVGSSSGIDQLVNGKTDFGASDMPMTDEQLAEAEAKLRCTVLHFPMVLGAAVPAYNVPGLKEELRFTPEALAGIFLGTIRRWDDPVIARSNPGSRLPANNIVVVHRAEGSGTSYCWTDYLSKVDPGWCKRVGKGTAVVWPTGNAAKGNDGVAGLIKQTPYAIGYLELTYAMQNVIAFGRVQNSTGAFVKADLASVAAAARGAAITLPAHFRVSITNAPSAEAYPISTFTWILVPARGSNIAARKALVSFLRWALRDGQRMVASLEYSPLPKDLTAREINTLKAIR